MTADENAAGLEVSTDDSAEDSGIVSDEEPAVPADTDEQSGTTGEDTEVESTEGGSAPELTAEVIEPDKVTAEQPDIPTVSNDTVQAGDFEISIAASDKYTVVDSGDGLGYDSGANTYTAEVTPASGRQIAGAKAYAYAQDSDTGVELKNVTVTDKAGAADGAKTVTISSLDNLEKADDESQNLPATTARIEITVAMATSAITVTVAGNNAADATVTYKINGKASEAETAEIGDTITPVVAIKNEPTTNDKYEVTIGDETKTIAKNTSEEFAAIPITEATTTITATVNALYGVTGSIVNADGTAVADAAAIKVVGGDGTETNLSESTTVKSGDSLKFKVELAEGYKLDTAGVTVKVGAAAGTPTLANGVYTLASVTGAVKITVTVAEITGYKVKFDITGATVQYKDGDENKNVTSGTTEITVNKGETLTFTVKPDVTDGKQLKLRTVDTTEDSGKTDGGVAKADDDGVYTYTFADYKVEGSNEDVTIYVKATALETYQVNFSYEPAAKSGEVTVSSVTTTTTAGATEKTLTALTGTGFEGAEDEEAQFVVAAKAGGSNYKVTSVTTGAEDEDVLSEKPVKVKDNKIVDASIEGATDALLYTLPALSGNVNVTISLALDENAEDVASAAFTVDGDENAYTVQIGTETYSPKEGENKFLKELTADDKEVTFTVNAAQYYEITKVAAIYNTKATNDKESEKKEVALTEDVENEATVPNQYTFDFTETNDNKVEIKVYAKTRGLEGETCIRFNINDPDFVSYTVDPNTDNNKGNVEKNSADSYLLAEGMQYFDFTINAKKNYKPEVTIGGDVITGEAGEETTINGIAVVPYAYTVLAKVLETNPMIVVDGEIVQKTIDILYDNNEVEIEYQTLNGEDADDYSYDYTAGTADSKAKDSWTVNADSTLILNAKALDNCKLATKYTVKSGDAEAVEKDLPADGRIVVTADADVIVTINSESVYGETLKGVEKAADGSYNINSGVTYTTTLVKGSSKAVQTLSDVKVFDKSKKEVTEQAVQNFTKGSTSADFAIINTGNAAVKYTVKLYVSETTGTGADAKTEEVEKASFDVNVLPALKTVNVTGVKTDGKLTQTVDTQKRYKITLNKAADITALSVDPAANDYVTAAIDTEKSELVITTKPVKEAKADAAVLQLYDNTVAKVDGKIAETAVLKKITLSTEAPALTAEKASAKLKTATDTSLILTTGVTKKVTQPYAGEIWYKAEVTTSEQGVTIPDALKTQYFKKDADKLSQDITVKVSSAPTGEGASHAYAVTISLVQTIDQTDMGAASEADRTAKTAFTNGENVNTVTASTKEPAYDNKLSLKKGTTTVYTGADAVTIATINFAGTYFDHAQAYDVDYPNASSFIDLDVENGAVKMAVQRFDGYDYLVPDTYIGKHTIRVVAAAADGAFGASATLTINVVRGIEKLSVTTPSDSIYKADKKPGTLTVTPVYNGGSTAKASVPKAKKVDYQIVSVDSYTSDGEFEGILNPLGKEVTIKNGKITVNKNYVVKDKKEANQFKVRVIAKDYTGNTTDVYSKTITITSEGLKMGDIHIVRKAGYSASWEDITKTEYTSGELYQDDGDGGNDINAKVVVLKDGVLTKDYYTDSDFVNASNLTVKSNKGDFVLTTTGTNAGKITNIKKTVKGVNLTVTANDGSKNKKELKGININPDKDGNFGLLIEQTDPYGSRYEIYEGPETTIDLQNSTSDTVLDLTVVKEDEHGNWNEISEYTDLKWAKTSGVKVLSKLPEYGRTNYNQHYQVIANTAKATIQLKFGSTTQTFTINNPNVRKDKAPTFKTADKLKAYSYGDSEQIRFTLSGTGSENWNGKYVMVVTDTTERIKTKETNVYYTQKLDYELFEKNRGNGYEQIKDNSFTLNFWNKDLYDEGFYWTGWDEKQNDYVERYDGVYLRNGSYKLQVTFGDLDEDGNFVAETQSKAITLKVTDGTKYANAKKFSYKPVTKVTLNLKDNAGVSLKGSGNYKVASGYEYIDYANAHLVAGSNKSNNFTDFFDFSYGRLSLKSTFGTNAKKIVAANGDLSKVKDISEEDAKKITDEAVIAWITGDTTEAKNNRIGNFQYYVKGYTNTTGYTTCTKKDWTQVTVNFAAASKTALKYTASKPTVVKGSDHATITISAAKAHASMYNPGAGKYPRIIISAPVGEEYSWDDTGYAYVGGYYGTQLILKLNNDAAKAVGKHKLSIYFLPDNSAYGDYFYNTLLKDVANETALTPEQQNKLMEYGVKVDTTITVAAKDKQGGKVSVSKNNLAQTFTPDGYRTDGTKNYYLDVPYTSMNNMPYGIKDITPAANTNAALKELFTFHSSHDVENHIDYIVIEMNKAKFEAAADDKNNKAVAYGKKVSVKVEITYGLKDEKGDVKEVDAEVKEDTITFSLTLPQKAKSYEDARKDAEDLQTTINERVTMNLGDDGYPTQDALRDTIYNVEAEIARVAPKNSDAYIVLPQLNDDGTVTVDPADYKEPVLDYDGNTCESGFLNVKAEVYNISTQAGAGTKVKDLTYKVVSGIQQDIISALQKFEESYEVTNATTEQELLTAARNYKAVKDLLESRPDLRLAYDYEDDADGFTIEPATAGNEGRITADFRAWSTLGSGVEACTGLSFTIEALQTLDQAETAVKNVVDKKQTNENLFKAYNSTTDALILAAAKKAVTNDQYDLKWEAIADDATVPTGFTKDDKAGNIWKKNATTSAPGVISGTLILTDTLAEKDAAENVKERKITVDLAITQLKTEAEALQAVKDVIGLDASGAITGDGLGKLVDLIKEGGNAKEGVKTAILTAVNDAVNEDGYTVAYDGDITFTAADYKLTGEGAAQKGKGSIAFTLQLTKGSGADAEPVITKIIVNATEFGPLPGLQTLTQAEADIQGYLDSLKGKDADAGYVDGSKLTALADLTAENADTVKEAVISEVNTKLVELVTGDGLEAAVVTEKDTDFTIARPTLAADGAISFKVLLTEKAAADGEEADEDAEAQASKELTFEAKIKRLTHADIAAARTDVETAIQNLAFSNDDIATDNDGAATGITDAARKRILDAAKEAINETQYSVNIAQKGEDPNKVDDVTATLATLTNGGSIVVKISLAPAATGSTEEAQEITKTWTIKSYKALAIEAIQKVVSGDEFDPEANDAGDTILQAAKDALGSAYTAEYKTGNGYSYDSDSDAISGTISITGTATGSTENAEINLATDIT
ncbi:MAG: hypothetical protein NC318_11050 [Blautia sp.]|nr:hypothetical protein [Blautia sp.]